MVIYTLQYDTRYIQRQIHINLFIHLVTHVTLYTLVTVYNLYITTKHIIYGHPPNIINNNTIFKVQLEVESITTSRYMCTYIDISKN